jgi:hypothetical protein
MRKTKFRLFACVLAVMCCMAAFSVTAFASDGGYYESDESGEATPPSSIDSITVSTEGVKLPENQGSEPLTPEGNLSLIDDILQNEAYASDEGVTVGDKQFITVQSKSGNYFYIVIDRSGDTENVYFLNLVDEADLMALMEEADGGDSLVCTCKDKCATGSVDTSCPVCKSNMSECAGKEAAASTPKPDADSDADSEKEPEKEKSGNNGLLLIVLVIALAGGGALYWFKFRKPKPDTKGPADLDDYDYGEDDEEYENEDEPEEADTEDNDE